MEKTKCSLNVCFVGEAGIDTGAIKKEFLAELVSGIEMCYFEPGNDNKGKNPIYSISALEDGYFRGFGEIIAVSLAQGGPAPDFMRNWCYRYLATGDLDRLAVTPEDVTDLETIQLVEKVRAATDGEIRSLADGLLSRGFTGPINAERKDPITRDIICLSAHLPFAEELESLMAAEKLWRIFNKHRVPVFFKPGNTLRQKLVHPKDCTPQEQPGVCSPMQ